MKAPVAPPAGGHLVVRSAGEDPLPVLLGDLERSGSRICRDVEIGGPADGTDLVAERRDFWFHTDAVFWKLPPRWVVIQLIESEGGGELEVADATGLVAELPTGPCHFGRVDAGRAAEVFEQTSRGALLRYRADYMHPLPGGVDLERLHALMNERLPAHVTEVGALGIGDCLVLDNWTQLHRRRNFSGNRRIRRVWLDGEP